MTRYCKRGTAGDGQARVAACKRLSTSDELNTIFQKFSNSGFGGHASEKAVADYCRDSRIHQQTTVHQKACLHEVYEIAINLFLFLM